VTSGAPALHPREYAPAAVAGVFTRLEELRPRVDWTLAGIVGDAEHVYGYHRARAVLPPDDYSVQLPPDQRGPEWAASALDIKPPDVAHQSRLTRRLLYASHTRDPHLTRVVREWYGSLDGVKVVGYDIPTMTPATADDSHLWHIHISFFRANLDRPALLRPVGDILAGRPGLE
jgi:hypothetical protein